MTRRKRELLFSSFPFLLSRIPSLLFLPFLVGGGFTERYAIRFFYPFFPSLRITLKEKDELLVVLFSFSFFPQALLFPPLSLL